MKTDSSIPNPIYRSAEKTENVYATEHFSQEPELIEMRIIVEFNAWEAASDEALENFERDVFLKPSD